MTLASANLKGRVLVADDVPDILEVTCRLIRRMGYEVLAARDGEETLAIAREMMPDLIVLDIMMPKLHGIDVMKALGADQGERPGVIVSSARDFKPDVDQAMELGAFAFLVKPYRPRELIDIVDRYFTQRAPSRRSAPPKAAPAEAPYLPVLDLSGGYWKLWGTRGSIPVTGSRYARHGGNTSCLQISRGEEIIIIDAGSGIRDLGMELVKGPPRRIRLMIGHTHWDHIQGFPFFAPAYVPGFQIDIYGVPGFGKDLESIFRGQLDRDYFPVELNDMAAELTFHRLESNPIEFGDVKVRWELMNHPGATIGFRFEVNGRSIVYMTDNEFLKGYVGPPHGIFRGCPLLEPFQRIVELASGADILITEAQYPNVEYLKKIGWGHSSISNACVLAREAKAKRWIITHHDPMHDDEMLLRKLDLTRQILREMNYEIIVSHAYDGMSHPL